MKQVAIFSQPQNNKSGMTESMVTRTPRIARRETGKNGERSSGCNTSPRSGCTDFARAGMAAARSGRGDCLANPACGEPAASAAGWGLDPAADAAEWRTGGVSRRVANSGVARPGGFGGLFRRRELGQGVLGVLAVDEQPLVGDGRFQQRPGLVGPVPGDQ